MPSTSSSSSSRTVLIVDDDTDVRVALQAHFHDRGFRTLTASNGADALRMIESELYIDLLVSDFVLPGANGRSIVKVAEFYRPEIKVIVITAQNPQMIPPELRSQLLQKPFSTSDIDRMVEQLYT